MADKPKKKTTWLVVDDRSTLPGSKLPWTMTTFKKVIMRSHSLKECKTYIENQSDGERQHMTITTQREVRSRKEEDAEY